MLVCFVLFVCLFVLIMNLNKAVSFGGFTDETEKSESAPEEKASGKKDGETAEEKMDEDSLKNEDEEDKKKGLYSSLYHSYILIILR